MLILDFVDKMASKQVVNDNKIIKKVKMYWKSNHVKRMLDNDNYVGHIW